MKIPTQALVISLVTAFATMGCKQASAVKNTNAGLPVEGTWRLVSGTLIEGGDTTFTDYTKGISMIKILNETHFAFVNHDLNHGKDSTASFSAGGGRYVLDGDTYTEFLEYCSAREWEGNEFKFNLQIKNDTLIQKGVEKIESISVERLNIEVYSRVQ